MVLPAYGIWSIDTRLPKLHIRTELTSEYAVHISLMI